MNFYNSAYSVFNKQKRLLVFLLIGQWSIAFANAPEFITVLSMYLKNPAEVGEIAPMSQIVGKELIKYVKNAGLDKESAGNYYLEAGGGCGAVSVCIAQALRPCDHLDVVEINPDMCVVLQERLKEFPNVTVHCCSILDWHPGYAYNGIISTLPFLSLGIDFAQNAISFFQKSAAKNCVVSCVEYPIAVVFRKFMHGLRIKDADFTAVQRYMALVRKQFLIESVTVYYNVPPINVYHLSFNDLG